MKNPIVAVFFASLLAIVGCMNHRFTAVPRVKDVGVTIRTKNRYSLAGFYLGDTKKPVEGNGLGELKVEMERSFPEVFGSGGIPFVLRDYGLGRYESSLPWTMFVYMFSFSTLPVIERRERVGTYVIEFPSRQEKTNLEIRRIWEEAMTCLSPFAWLFLNDPLEIDGHRSFGEVRSTTAFDELDKNEIAHKWYHGGWFDGNDIERKAVAYGVAQQLQELENAGRIVQGEETDSSQKHQSYRVVSIRRETDRDFAYLFVLELDANIPNPLQASRAIQLDFQKALREDYVETALGTAISSLIVDFPEYRLTDRRIEGWAVVLTIEVDSLLYDPNTHRGKLSVRFGPNQYEDARKYARRNIETLVRDKNVALVAGAIPSEARFYIFDERVKEGNILEIEFKAE